MMMRTHISRASPPQSTPPSVWPQLQSTPKSLTGLQQTSTPNVPSSPVQLQQFPIPRRFPGSKRALGQRGTQK